MRPAGLLGDDRRRLRFARQAIKPFLPIELTHLIEVPYLGHFAESDSLIPAEDVD